MKSEKGITILSLTVYVVVMTVVIAVTARVSTFLFKNMDQTEKVDALTQYTTFSSYFTEEVNTPNIKILECEENYVAFDNGVQYSYNAENKGIYRGQVKICSDIEKCTFEQGVNKNGYATIKVTVKALNDEVENREPIVYTLK